jgi:hypothetical protein
MVECPVCNRPSFESGEYCKYHEDAHVKLQEMFESWREAHGDIEWEKYLELVLEADGTGNWILEVINHIKIEDSS